MFYFLTWVVGDTGIYCIIICYAFLLYGLLFHNKNKLKKKHFKVHKISKLYSEALAVLLTKDLSQYQNNSCKKKQI